MKRLFARSLCRRVLRPQHATAIAYRHNTHPPSLLHTTGASAAPAIEDIIQLAQRDAAFKQQLADALQKAEQTTANDTKQPKELLVVDPLTRRQWVKFFVRTAAPFFGFGICDNLIMITVGDLIDTHFGVTMGFSTMVAAGLGQACSDGAGITIQGTIEASADRMGLPNPELTEAQKSCTKLLFWQHVFRTIGIISGCLFGLVPVILFDTGNRPRLYDQLLSVLPEPHRKELSSKGQYVEMQEGEYILRYGEEADALYTIVRGEVSVVGRSDSGDPQEFCRNGPGCNLGIVELVFKHKCVADVIAVTPVTLLKIDSKDFDSCSRLDDIQKVVTKHVMEDDSFVVYRARHMGKRGEQKPLPHHHPKVEATLA